MTRFATASAGDVWRPQPEDLARSRLARFCAGLGCATVPELDALSRRDPAAYWSAVADALDLDWLTPPTATLDQLDEPWRTQWFPGSRFNLADNAVDRWVRRGRGDEPALRWESEDRAVGAYSFAELAAEVDRVGRGLQHLGVRPGDAVGMQLPPVAESAVVQLACAKIGAVLVPVFSGFGPGLVADRLELAGAGVHVVADGFPRRGRTVALRPHAAEALARVASVRHTVVVPVTGEREPRLPGEVAWTDLGAGDESLLEPYPCAPDHPLFVAFTSGTTGPPKGIVLGHQGFAVKAGSDVALCFDAGPGDVATWVTDPGWVMSPITVLGGLVAGSAVAVYSGAVDHPTPARLWEVARRLEVSMLGVSPTLVRSLMAHGPAALPRDLGRVRVFASSGEPWTPDAYAWLFRDVGGGRLPVINYSGGTEVSGAILSNTTIQPIHPCGFAGPVPGMAADVVDDDGHTIPHGVGELALRLPSPGMPLTFWNEPARYRSTYWERWPDVWYHGDWVEIDDDDVWFIRGRSDDTLNLAGKRLGPAEVESVTNAVPFVLESAAIGVPDPVKGEALVVFARLDPAGAVDSEEASASIEAALVEQLGKPLRPKAVHIVQSLPRTRSGKILRRVVRAVYLGDDPGDTSSLDDPEALAHVRSAR